MKSVVSVNVWVPLGGVVVGTVVGVVVGTVVGVVVGVGFGTVDVGAGVGDAHSVAHDAESPLSQKQRSKHAVQLPHAGAVEQPGCVATTCALTLCWSFPPQDARRAARKPIERTVVGVVMMAKAISSV